MKNDFGKKPKTGCPPPLLSDATIRNLPEFSSDKPLSQSQIQKAEVTPVSELEYRETCLEDPEIQQIIYNKAQEISDWVAEEKVKEKLRKKRDQRLDEIYDRYDKGEAMFSNAVNTYSQEYQVEEEIAVQLQQIVEDGFNAQRDILARFQAEEISKEEAKQLGRDLRESDKQAVVDLLGEEGAMIFGDVVRDQKE